jgi:peptidylprolyl isomerase
MRLNLAVLSLAALATAAPALAQAPARGAAARPAAAAALPPATAADWRTVDPENTVVIDTTKGRVIVELAPEAAPKHVERVKQLVREKFYNGLAFHRVIDNFMAQTGDPLGTGEGQSPYPDVEGEFTFRRGVETPFTSIAAPSGSQVGFLRSLPVASQPDAQMMITADGKASAWGLFCPGVAGMARGDDPNSANSQFFLMRFSYPSLDKRYTTFGRVVSGLDVVRRIKVGEPVVDPDRMTAVTLLSDMPAAERPVVRVLDMKSARFKAMVAQARAAKGADFSACDVELPAEVAPAAPAR